MKTFCCSLLLVCYLSVLTAQKVAKPGDRILWGTINGLRIEGVVESPASNSTTLQVACLFEYTPSDIYSPPALPEGENGMVHLDQSLHHFITHIRKSKQFLGHQNETLLLIPPPNTIPAKYLLLVGLGDREYFDAEKMYSVGITAVREACRLGLQEVSIASDVKDAGIDSPTEAVAKNIAVGSVMAYRTQQYLHHMGMSPKPSVKTITLLAGPQFFYTSGQGIQAGLDSLKLLPPPATTGTQTSL
ncbi:cytosol aminopeptidase family protein [Chitinophaga skermanii]|uniref:Cytosol aminopeptidase family protein n=1 Tax=Chitinophaga skermanii TaxID=331697 RepID=A0A327QS62_9BACT|nr:M17 family peptidase N-terminal domain-containing protein [Chitinophaga skermanii]RAJ06532.1 cytosol aminopeptidase family protein [Chitinophaga skermanii]